MNPILFAFAIFPVAPPEAGIGLDVITAAKRVVITGSSTSRDVLVRALDGAAAPSRTVNEGRVVIRDADESARIVNGTYRIIVPLNTQLRVRIRCEIVENQPCPNSTVSIENVGVVKFESVDGKAEISRINGDVHAATLHGSLTISAVKGSVVAASQTNAINVNDVTGNLVTRSITGMTSISSALGGAKATNTTGEIKLAGRVSKSSQYSLTTDIGHIRLGLADGSDATIEANAPPERITIHGPGARRTHVNGRRSIIIVGSGGARITAETLNGGIEIR